MSDKLQPGERPPELTLLVADSGRTWLVGYDEIQQIPPEALQLGDVLIVHHPTEPGRMVLQCTDLEEPSRWIFESIQFAKDVEC